MAESSGGELWILSAVPVPGAAQAECPSH